MVWFQCEDCGENLKKPKLLNHFRVCSAFKLSCIDCGEIFGQQSVQGHTQCITEAEKYGPKGQGKDSHTTPAKPNNDSKPKPDVDINVGLSSRAPWFCSLCNTKATSRQTLLLHADGKKHRTKARAFHSANKQAKQTEESTPSCNDSIDNPPKEESLGHKDREKPNEQDLPITNGGHSSVAENGSLPSKKKRKFEASENRVAKKESNSGDLSNGEVIQADRSEAEEEPNCQAKKTKHVNVPEEDKKDEIGYAEEPTTKKIKWKKIIISILKLNPEGSLKMRKLQKLVLNALNESGVDQDEAHLKDLLVEKINSSSRFVVENKLVRLVAKS